MSMNNFSKDLILHGTNGRLRVDGEVVLAVQSCEANITMNYDELNINGRFISVHRYLGGSISGTITVHKHDSWLLKATAKAPAAGVMPNYTIEVENFDPQTNQRELIVYYNCQFESVKNGFENNSLETDDWSFVADDYEIISTIN